MDSIPIELKYQILLNLDYRDIERMCQVDKNFNNICKDKHFWTQKAKVDFGDDALIFPDKFTSPMVAYLELYSQYHLPTNCEKYLSIKGCMVRAIEDKDLNSLITLSERLTPCDRIIVPYSLSRRYNFIPGLVYFGYKDENAIYFLYGMYFNVDDMVYILDDLDENDEDDWERIASIIDGAAYMGNEELFEYLFNIYDYSLIEPAYLTGRGGGNLKYLTKYAYKNALLKDYVRGLLYSGYTNIFSIADKIHFDVNLLLSEVIAFGTGNIDVIKYLLSRGAKVNDDTIISSVYNYNFPAIKLLINDSSDLNYAVVVAIKTQNRYLVKYLLAKGANVDHVIDIIIGSEIYEYAEIIRALKGDSDAIFKTLTLSASNEQVNRLSMFIDNYV